MGRIKDRKVSKKIEYFQKYPLFKPGPHSFFEILFMYKKEKEFGKGKVLVDYGSLVEGFYMLISGRVDVT